MAGNRVVLVISADNKVAIEGMEQYNAGLDNMGKKTGTVTSGMSAAWLGYSAAVYAAYRTARQAWDMAEFAAKFDEERRALQGLSSQYGMTADAVIEAVQRAAGETVSRSEAISVANKGLLMGLDPRQIASFAEGAERFADALGTDLAGAFGTLTQAAATGNEKMLRQLGIITDIDPAYRRYAEAHHKAVEELTQEERQAVSVIEMQKALEAAIRRMGPAADTASDKMARFKASVSDLYIEVGNLLLPAMGRLAEVMTMSARGWTTILEGAPSGARAIAAYRIEIERLNEELKKAREAPVPSSWDFVGKILASLSLAPEQIEERIRAVEEKLKDERLLSMLASTMQAPKKAGASSGMTEAQLAEEKKRTEAFVAIQKPYIEELARMNDAYAKANLTREEYLAGYAVELAAKRVDAGLINEIVFAKRRELEEDEKKKALDADKKIWDTVLATEKLNASKERLIELQALEYSQAGATVEQVEKYTAALNAQSDAEQALDDKKRQARAASDLAGLGPAPEVMTVGGDAMPQQFDEAARMQERLNQLADHHARRIQLLIDAGHTEEEINAAKNEAQLAHDRQTAQLRLSTAAGTMGMMANLMQNLYMATGSKNKEMFTLMKMFAISEATIKGYQAAVDAWEWGNKIGGPPLGAIALATSVAATGAMIQKIASTQPGSATGTISAGGRAIPPYSGGSPSAYPPVQPVEQKKESPVVQIHIYGDVLNNYDELARKIVRPIQKAIADNVH